MLALRSLRIKGWWRLDHQGPGEIGVHSMTRVHHDFIQSEPGTFGDRKRKARRRLGRQGEIGVHSVRVCFIQSEPAGTFGDRKQKARQRLGRQGEIGVHSAVRVHFIQSEPGTFGDRKQRARQRLGRQGEIGASAHSVLRMHSIQRQLGIFWDRKRHCVLKCR